MIQIDDTLISELLLEKRFVCDLNACKGACCIEGDAGAPLEDEELEILDEIYDEVKPFLRPEGISALETEGLYTVDVDGEYVTTLVEGKECAYTIFDDKGIAKCGIEEAWNQGKVDFRKPISCHLYPVRIGRLHDMLAVNYSKWQICEPACECGSKLDVKVYRFLKEALTRKFGPEWYAALESVDHELNNIAK